MASPKRVMAEMIRRRAQPISFSRYPKGIEPSIEGTHVEDILIDNGGR
jgi:hypothetical protein